MQERIAHEAKTIEFPNQAQFTTIGNNALKLDILPAPVPNQVQIIEFRGNTVPNNDQEARAFKHEFYKTAMDRQIEDDIVSYLGEYRFEVSEFEYRLDIIKDQLVDPASGDLMVEKAKKAIEEKKKEGISAKREEAELVGLISLQDQLRDNPDGTVVWFSPPGPKELGYGEYGFSYIGKRRGEVLEMTAIRLEDPKLSDFNRATQALWGKDDFKKAEEFLSLPMVLGIDLQRAKEFIHGNFEIKDDQSKTVFAKAMRVLEPQRKEFIQVVKRGVKKEIHDAIHTMENLSLELKAIYKEELAPGNVVFLQDYQAPALVFAMQMEKYTVPPPAVGGSCGITVRQESNDIFRNLNTSPKTVTKDRDFDFDQPGPCRLCERDVPCGPCKICESCNDKIDVKELSD